jgi:hypothetical protein
MMATTRLLTAFCLFVTAAAANAFTLHVNCGAQSGLTSIGAAIKLVQSSEETGPVTILVAGNCRENVVVQSIDRRLTLTAVNNASITDASGGKLDVILVQDSRDVSINGFTINAGADGVSGSSGVNCGDVSVCRLSGNLIQGALDASGLVVGFEAIARVNGDVLQGNGSGIIVGTTSEVQGNNFTARNNFFGIELERGQANIAGCTIENNSGDGAFLRGNALLNVNGCSISKNAGNGVSLTDASYARLGSAVISANGGVGVLLMDLSMARFPGATVTGNLGGSDVFCGPQYTATRGAVGMIGVRTNCIEP